MDFVDLPDILRDNANFMALVHQAVGVRADRSARRDNVAHRLRLMEIGDAQVNSPEAMQAVQEELREADLALHEALVMIDDLKALVVKLSPAVPSDEEGAINSDSTSRHSIDAISSD